MHWGVFAISAAHLYLPKLPWRAPTPVRLVKEWILMLILIKKTINLKTVYILISDVFFSSKKCHKMFGPPLCHLDQWCNFFTGPNFFFGPSIGWPSFEALYILCVYAIMAPAHESETIVFNFRKLLSTLPKYAELEQILLFSVNWGEQVCNMLRSVLTIKGQLQHVAISSDN
jgi:hypothetical protein